jgi:hypothetical protein
LLHVAEWLNPGTVTSFGTGCQRHGGGVIQNDSTGRPITNALARGFEVDGVCRDRSDRKLGAFEGRIAGN